MSVTSLTSTTSMLNMRDVSYQCDLYARCVYYITYQYDLYAALAPTVDTRIVVLFERVLP